MACDDRGICKIIQVPWPVGGIHSTMFFSKGFQPCRIFHENTSFCFMVDFIFKILQELRVFKDVNEFPVMNIFTGELYNGAGLYLT